MPQADFTKCEGYKIASSRIKKNEDKIQALESRIEMLEKNSAITVERISSIKESLDAIRDVMEKGFKSVNDRMDKMGEMFATKEDLQNKMNLISADGKYSKIFFGVLGSCVGAILMVLILAILSTQIAT